MPTILGAATLVLTTRFWVNSCGMIPAIRKSYQNCLSEIYDEGFQLALVMRKAMIDGVCLYCQTFQNVEKGS